MVSADVLSDDIVREQRAARRDMADALTSSLLMFAQKVERSALARAALREAETHAKEVGIGPRESSHARDCAALAVGAARDVRNATRELAQQLRETIRELHREVL